MALTLLNLKNHAQLEGDISSAFDITSVINDAGRYLLDMHAWNCAVAPPVTLNFLASRTYVELPADFGKPIEVVMTAGLTSSFSFTSLANVLRMRSDSVTQAYQHYFGAVVFPNQAQPTDPPLPPRIELWPTPSSASSAVMTIAYRKRWKNLEQDTDEVNVDESLYSLLRRLVRIFAKAYDSEDTGTLEERLEAIEQSTFYLRLKENDGLRQPDYGPTTGGAINGGSPYWNDYGFRVNATASDPS